MTRRQRRTHAIAWLILGPALMILVVSVMLLHEPASRPVDGVSTSGLSEAPTP